MARQNQVSVKVILGFGGREWFRKKRTIFRPDLLAKRLEFRVQPASRAPTTDHGLLLHPTGNVSITGCLASQQPGEVEARHGGAAFGAAFEV
jgi:hypothetical protein